MTEFSLYLGYIAFFNNEKEYGFITDVVSQKDYYVHISMIKTLPINKNDKVVFELMPSEKKQHTLAAKNVTLLSEFNSDMDFLIEKYLELSGFNSDIDFLIKKHSDVTVFLFKKSILKTLPKDCIAYVFEQEIAMQNSISSDLEYKNYKSKLSSMNVIYGNIITKDILSNLISNHAEKTASDDFKVQLWLDDIIKSEPDISLISNYFETQNKINQENIYLKVNNLNKILLFSKHINKKNTNSLLYSLKNFIQFEEQVELQIEFIQKANDRFAFEKFNAEWSSEEYLDILYFIKPLYANTKKLFTYFFYNISSDDTKIKLWFDNLIDFEPNISIIYNYFACQNERDKKTIYTKINDLNKILFFRKNIEKKNAYVVVCSLMFFVQLEKQVELQKEFILLASSMFTFEKLSLEQSDKVYNNDLKFIHNLDMTIRELFMSFFYAIAADYIKLKLWITDSIHQGDYDIYQANFIFLNTHEQQKFIKKLFYLLSIKAENISYDRIFKLINLTYTFSEGKQFKLDFSCNIVLNSIESIKKGGFPSEEDVFYVLTKHIENNTDSLLSLSSFFEKCNNRSIPDKIIESEDGSKEIVTLRIIPIPKNIEFCEGVKYGGDGKDKTYKHDCWWCRGGSCYNANQSIQLPSDYNNYTLANFLTILGVSFSLKGYFDFLGLMNKINVYLTHLNCRDCNHILKPYEENYYSYYRISNFVCSNLKCQNKDKIYLNHCLGSHNKKTRCENLIDSRDTKRCNYFKHNPSNIWQKYGPYICNSCGSCCSQKSLEKKYNELKERKWSIQPGLKWKIDNTVGHLERGEIFCYECGEEMSDIKKEYNEFLHKLENPDDSFRLLRRGDNVYGFWYLIEADEVMFEKAKQVGLKVSMSNNYQETVKFIGKGRYNANILFCKNCNIKYSKSKFEFIAKKQDLVE